MRTILFVLCLFLFSCTSKNNDKYVLKKIEDASLMRKIDSDYHVIDVDCALKVNMDSVVRRLDSISYVPLESSDLIGEMDKVLVYDGKIFILDAFVAEKVFIFDRQGRLLKTIDDKGQGPNEFIGLSGMAIDFERKELCLNDRLSMKRLYYNLNGEFLRKEEGVPCFYLNVLNDFVINQLSFRQSFSEDVNYHLVSAKLDSVYSKGFPYEPIQKNYTVSRNAVYNSMNDLLFVPVLSDTVYHIKSYNEYSVRYVIKHEHSIWDKNQEELSYNEIANLIKNDEYTAFGGVFYETSNYIFFMMARKLDQFVVNKHFLFNKKNGEVYELNGSDMEIIEEIVPPQLIALDGETCVASFDAYRIKELLSENCNKYAIKNDDLKAIIENSDEDTNPILVFFRLQ